MQTLFMNIVIQGRLVVVVGGGPVALRKVRTLLTTGATVGLVAIQILPELAILAEQHGVKVRHAAYHSTDIDDAFMVIAATNSEELNQQIAADATARGTLISVVDNPSIGNCSFPALLRRDDLEIAVSTGGSCPAFAMVVRDVIATVIGSEYGQILKQLSEEREKLLTDGDSSTYNALVLRSRAEQLIGELTERKDVA
jgi:precorrin-2 dehydrogenase/sirohydrochlorin ferrochelatase